MGSSSAADSGVLSSLGQDANRERRKPKPSSLQDRFIPSRGVADARITCFEIAQAQTMPPQHQDMNASPAKEEYKRTLASKLFQDVPLHDQRILAFSGRQPQQSTEPPLRLLYNANREAAMQPRKHTRHIPQSPERILDAPDLLDDYYLNLLDWNAQNILGAAHSAPDPPPAHTQPLRTACAPLLVCLSACPCTGAASPWPRARAGVALSDSVYLWNAGNGGITQLMQTQGEGSHVTSVAWSQKSSLMAIGTSNNEVQLWDAEKCKLLRNMPGHCARVGALAWNGHVLSSGSRDATITHHDHRAARQRGQRAALAVPPLAAVRDWGARHVLGPGLLCAPRRRARAAQGPTGSPRRAAAEPACQRRSLLACRRSTRWRRCTDTSRKSVGSSGPQAVCSSPRAATTTC